MSRGFGARTRGGTGALAASVVAAALLAPAAAGAAEWRYCYGLVDDGHRFAMSRAFQTGDAMEALERRFREDLAGAGLAATRTACPRADGREAVAAMMRGAADYNRTLGHAVLPRDWPAADPVAAR